MKFSALFMEKVCLGTKDWTSNLDDSLQRHESFCNAVSSILVYAPATTVRGPPITASRRKLQITNRKCSHRKVHERRVDLCIMLRIKITRVYDSRIM